MKTYTTTLDVTISIAELHYMEDFVAEYISPSVIEQALEGVSTDELDAAYRTVIINEYLHESVLRGQQCE